MTTTKPCCNKCSPKGGVCVHPACKCHAATAAPESMCDCTEAILNGGMCVHKAVREVAKIAFSPESVPAQEGWEKALTGMYDYSNTTPGSNAYEADLTELKLFVLQLIAAAQDEGRLAALTELPPMQGEDGKLYSRVIAKAMEAPFPEVALQHAMKRVAEKYTAEGRRAMREEILAAIIEDLPRSSHADLTSYYEGVEVVRAIITAKQ